MLSVNVRQLSACRDNDDTEKCPDVGSGKGCLISGPGKKPDPDDYSFVPFWNDSDCPEF